VTGILDSLQPPLLIFMALAAAGSPGAGERAAGPGYEDLNSVVAVLAVSSDASGKRIGVAFSRPRPRTHMNDRAVTEVGVLEALDGSHMSAAEAVVISFQPTRLCVCGPSLAKGQSFVHSSVWRDSLTREPPCLPELGFPECFCSCIHLIATFSPWR
jgi:hypothetical protein